MLQAINLCVCVGVARVKWSSRADMEDRTELTFIYELVDLNNTDNFCHYNFVITNSVTTKSVVSFNLCTPTA